MELDENIRETEERLFTLKGERETAKADDPARLDTSIYEAEVALNYLYALKDEVSRHGTDNMARGKDLKGN